jgi:hypothetical protein
MPFKLYGKFSGLPVGHMGTATNPAQSCQALASAGLTRSGEYVIGAGVDVSRVWCQLDVPEYPGGWELLLKAAEGTTFEYGATHWTQPTTLNEHDISLDAVDAKYRSFNDAEITDILAHFPDITSGHAYWHAGPFAPTTALSLFSDPWVLSEHPLTEQRGWNGEYFSHQDGAQKYSFNNINGDRPQYNVRWGYSWNNEGDFNSNDAGGGIGLSGDHAMSAGDWFSCCGTRAPNGAPTDGGQTMFRVELYGAFLRVPEGQLGTATNPAPGCEELAGVVSVDGAYHLRRAVSGAPPHQIYCDLTTPGLTHPERGPGGWALLLKATRGNTFAFDSEYWTTPNVLNTEDVTLDDSDAKFRAFNEATISELMARWPEQPDFVWQVGPFPPTTALQFFQRPEALSSTPLSDPAFNADMFSHQEGTQLYSIAHQSPGKSVRWGFSWNNEADWNSADVAGGIGLLGGDLDWSAGDFFGCCGTQAPNGNTQMRVEIYGRYGGALQGALGSESNPAVSCGEFRDASASNLHSEAIWVGYGMEISHVFCENAYDGGGWTLLMKAAQGETFAYDAPYWTEPNVLNDDDLTLNDGAENCPLFFCIFPIGIPKRGPRTSSSSPVCISPILPEFRPAANRSAPRHAPPPPVSPVAAAVAAAIPYMRQTNALELRNLHRYVSGMASAAG